MSIPIKKLNLSGQVRHLGMPVSSVEVKLYQQYAVDGGGIHYSAGPLDVKRTTRNGEFEFLVPPGSYCLEAVPNSDNRLLKCKVENVRVDKSSTTHNIGLQPGTVLRGRIITADGDEIESGEIMALGIEPSSYWSKAEIEGDGSFCLVLPKGKFQLCTHGSTVGHDVSDNGGNFAYISTQVSVIDIYGDQKVELILPRLLKFAGEVFDVFGQPVVDTMVRLTPQDQEGRLTLNDMHLDVSTSTDEKGKFEVFLQTGTYNLEIQPKDSSKHFGLLEEKIKVSTTAIRKYTLEEGYRLQGEVTYDEEALPNCLVRVQSLNSDKEFIAKTDEKGRFGVSVPGGNYMLVVSAHPKNSPTVTIDGADHTGLAPWAKIIVVGVDTHVDIRLKEGTALRGRVLDDAGQARPGVKVSVFSFDEKEKNKKNHEKVQDIKDKLNRALAHAVTDSDGRYSIFLSQGSYLLVVHKDLDNGICVKVENEPVNVDINWHGWCQVRFEVLGDDQAKIPRCQVKYLPYGQSEDDFDDSKSDDLPFGFVMTGDDGICRLTLPTGVYAFQFSPPEAGSYEAKNIRQLSISKDLNKKVVLPHKLLDLD